MNISLIICILSTKEKTNTKFAQEYIIKRKDNQYVECHVIW